MSEPRIISEPVAATRRFRHRRAVIALAGALAGAVLVPVGAFAQQPSTQPGATSVRHLLDGPRAAGLVGERFDGYAVPHGSVPPDVAALIDQVNTHRKDTYEKRAVARNVPADAIGRLYAAEIVRRAPAGTWFLGENGRWTRK